MTLSELANIGEVIAAICIVISLIFVGLQMRQNTRAVKAQIHENIMSGYLSVANVVIPHANIFSKGICSDDESFSSLTAEEKMIFFSSIFSLFKHFEHMYSLFKKGLIDAEAWAAWSEHIYMYFHQPGVQLWWPQRKKSFIKSFRDFLDNSTKPTGTPSIAELIQKT